MLLGWRFEHLIFRYKYGQNSAVFQSTHGDKQWELFARRLRKSRKLKQNRSCLFLNKRLLTRSESNKYTLTQRPLLSSSDYCHVTKKYQTGLTPAPLGLARGPPRRRRRYSIALIAFSLARKEKCEIVLPWQPSWWPWLGWIRPDCHSNTCMLKDKTQVLF